MKASNQFNIRWTQITNVTFMYGSMLHFKPTVTSFDNVLMPSGIVIHEWRMMTNYSENQIIPTLPILNKRKMYRFNFEYDVTPVGGVYFKIIFKRRNGTICHHKIVKGHEAVVEMPVEAFSYIVQMINAASKTLSFKQIVIQEMTDQMLSTARPVVVSQLLQVDPSTPYATVVFVEQDGLQQDAIQHIKNCLLVTNWVQDNMDRVIKDLETALASYHKEYRLQFVGYHARSNEMAYIMGARFKTSVFVTSQRHLEMQQRFGTANLDLSDVTIYRSYEDELSVPLQFVDPILNSSRHLYNLERQWVNGGVS
ncbi:TPA: accessory Sec system protein Asp3 [Staphylococcus delphini]|nr:accessory Sec system protein Asp3 [Staphylococcus delphini]HEC2196005.1 accessory Sec system protein Asp3 [Staphylococcus delphini]